jgi:serine/threonine-protein phosphatase PP1 catalytic subunit
MSNNLISFVNHLLTYDSQYNIIIKKNPKMIDHPFRFNINSNTMNSLALKCKTIFSKEPNVLNLDAPIYLFGDIHGQFQDLIRFLRITGLPPKKKILFMGDYVDRGNNSIEVVALIFAMKILYPKHVYVLRGNHECSNVNMNYGFYQECKDRFSDVLETDNPFYSINNALMSLPLTAIIGGRIFCVHGGLSPNLKFVSDINKINRFQKIPDKGLLADLLWSDPKSTDKDWVLNDRGISYYYNEKAIDKFLMDNNLDLICRAHQMVVDGYHFFNNNRLVTIFSAPNYCGNCGNNGAVMNINDDFVCSFIVIKPINDKVEK